MPSANPVMNPDVYRRELMDSPTASAMSMSGTVIKTAFLMSLLLITAGYTWYLSLDEANTLMMRGAILIGAIGGLVMALVTSFFPKASPFTSPVYAAFEGMFLGGISVIFEARFPGIVVQAVGLSVAMLTMMLFLYGTGVIRATEKFKMGIMAATGAIFLVYMASMLLSFFGVRVPFIHESGLFGIGFSVVVVVIAALNLILDFDFIEQGVRSRAPKYMEWYGGFSLLVTLVRMYLEILRLLSKLRNSND